MNWKKIILAYTLVFHAASTWAQLPPFPPPARPDVRMPLPPQPVLPTLPDPKSLLPPLPDLPVLPPAPVPPVLGATDATTTYTLLTAMVAEGANIWLPSTLILKNNTMATLTLRNVSKVEHGFAIDALGIRETLPAGETKTVVITPVGSDTLRYYCPLHKGHVGGQILIQ